MGIYLPNMEMPGSCYYCPFADGSWGYSPPHKKRCLISGKDMPVDERYVQKNQPVCPLAPVPPHGRLIDADEFLKRAIGTKCFRGDYALMLEELVGESTTIIPAEEGET